MQTLGKTKQSKKTTPRKAKDRKKALKLAYYLVLSRKRGKSYGLKSIADYTIKQTGTGLLRNSTHVNKHPSAPPTHTETHT